MSPSRRKRKRAAPDMGKASPSPPQLRPGMPARDNIQKVRDFVSPEGVPYKILETTEVDAYDPPAIAPKKRGRG